LEKASACWAVGNAMFTTVLSRMTISWAMPSTPRIHHRIVWFAAWSVVSATFTGEVPDGLDWTALAKAAPTRVFYMALKHLDIIARRLMAAGRPADEPVAVVSKATTPAQRVLVTTLGRAAAEAAAAGIEPPAIVAVGPAVRLRASLAWLET